MGLICAMHTTNDETNISQYKVDVLLCRHHVDIAIGGLVNLGMLVSNEFSGFGDGLCDLVRRKFEGWLAVGGAFIRFNVGYSNILFLGCRHKKA